MKVIDTIKRDNVEHAIAINLSIKTIQDSGFESWFSDLIKKNQSIAKQMVFSFSSYAVAKELNKYKEFINFVHKLGIKVIIKRFETQSMSSEAVIELKPDFIRLARDLGHGISIDEEKKIVVETIQGIGDLLDISILAENVQSEDDFTCIKDIGLSGASRQALK
jgi:EAL domain-containing protein (putative c-di-GMP-specific phosphodiesterase class I)